MTRSRYAERMAQVDGCPECTVNSEAPYSVMGYDVGGGYRADYRCTDCGHQWFTSWSDA